MSNGPLRTVRCLSDPALLPAEHEQATHRCVMARLAALLRLPTGGEWTVSMPAAATYFVPRQTLSGAQAASCGIRCADDLFGGVVPEPHMGTKVITHGLFSPASTAPSGWCAAFTEAVAEVVLRGYSVFDRGDLQRAGRALLDEGGLRLKLPNGIGGQDQRVITDPGQLAGLYALPAESERLAGEGLVLEENLAAVITRSVGQVWLGGIRMSYVGVQGSTPDNHGAPVYGGSDLWCVRGGFGALEQLDTDANAQLAIRQARTYHEAALRCFPGIILSRANYDVAQGTDAQGHWRSGVLEQSWRAGGASAAEIEAVAILQQQPQRQTVHVRTVERYGDAVAPPGAIVLFHGHDPRNGPMLKYAEVIPDATA